MCRSHFSSVRLKAIADAEERMIKYNPTEDLNGISLELFHPIKRLHFMFTFWRKPPENENEATLRNMADTILEVQCFKRRL